MNANCLQQPSSLELMVPVQFWSLFQPSGSVTSELCCPSRWNRTEEMGWSLSPVTLHSWSHAVPQFVCLHMSIFGAFNIKKFLCYCPEWLKMLCYFMLANEHSIISLTLLWPHYPGKEEAVCLSLMESWDYLITVIFWQFIGANGSVQTSKEVPSLL